MKRGPLSKQEKEFIDNNLAMDVKQLSEKLNRSTKTLAKYIKISTSPKPNLFATNPERGVVVMTESASTAADESRPKRSSQMPSRYQAGVIHTIKEQ